MKRALLLTSSAVLFTTRIAAFSPVVNIINKSISRKGNGLLGHNNLRLFSTMNTNTNTDDDESSVSSSRRTTTTSIFGGDYAGHSATFSSLDGTLIPVPDNLVPESMVEWGQVPSCLECLVSEDVLLLQEDEEDDSAGNDDHQRFILERNTVSVMPEVGCGLDNLDTTKVTERIPVDQYQEFTVGDDVTVSTVFVVEGKNRHVECVFLTKNNSNNVERTRVRVHLQQENNTNQLARSTPIVVTKERQTSPESSRGTIANGGGLDARTVTTLIGKKLLVANKPFSDRTAVDLVTLEGKWKKSTSTTVTNNKDDVAAAADTERDRTFWNNTLSLGGNILVRYNNSSSSSSPPCTSLEISLILLDASSAADVPMKRVVVHRLLPETENDNDNDNNAGAGATTVHCYKEVKE